MTASVVSMRGFKAHRIYQRYHTLPADRRTRERAEPLLLAILDYSFEHVHGPAGILKRPHITTNADLDKIVEKLNEFLPADATPDAEKILEWAQQHAILQTWRSSEALIDFFQGCIQQGSRQRSG